MRHFLAPQVIQTNTPKTKINNESWKSHLEWSGSVGPNGSASCSVKEKGAARFTACAGTSWPSICFQSSSSISCTWIEMATPSMAGHRGWVKRQKKDDQRPKTSKFFLHKKTLQFGKPEPRLSTVSSSSGTMVLSVALQRDHASNTSPMGIRPISLWKAALTFLFRHWTLLFSLTIIWFLNRGLPQSQQEPDVWLKKEAANGGGPASTCSNSCWNGYPLKSDPRFPGIPQVVEEQLSSSEELSKKNLGIFPCQVWFPECSITKSPHHSSEMMWNTLKRSSEPRRLTGSETLIASCCWLIHPGSRQNFGAPGYPRSDWGFNRSFWWCSNSNRFKWIPLLWNEQAPQSQVSQVPPSPAIDVPTPSPSSPLLPSRRFQDSWAQPCPQKWGKRLSCRFSTKIWANHT